MPPPERPPGRPLDVVSASETELASATDADLMAAIARGDAGALEVLYHRHAGEALALAVRMLRTRAEAEDVVQEAFVHAWRRASDFDPARGSAGAWLTTITRSRVLDRLRRLTLGRRVLLALSREPSPSPPASPIEDVVRRMERDRVSSALAALPAEQRDVIAFAYFGGLSQSEIAASTGEPLGTVKTRVRLAMEKLSLLLGSNT